MSAPNKDAGAPDAGQVQIFPLDDLGAEVTHNQTAASPPVANAHFGDGLGFVAGVAERSFLVGVPDEGQYGMVTVIPSTGATMRYWRPGEGTGADRFGGAAGGEVQQ